MSNDPKKPFVHMLPAVLTGAAALIASLTAVYVNVRNDRVPATPAAVAVSPAPIVDTPPAPVVPKPPERLVLQLERIAVRHDGAMGSADWRFTVEADDEPLLAFVSDGMDDSGGHNVVLPKDVSSALRIASSGSRIIVKAWHSRRFRLGERPPDAVGEGALSLDGSIAPLRVAADEPERGEFMFYFSTTPDPR